MSKYVGMKIGKLHDSHVISEYYCGGCGYPITDHDSFCSECGGALRMEDSSKETNDLEAIVSKIEHVQHNIKKDGRDLTNDAAIYLLDLLKTFVLELKEKK